MRRWVAALLWLLPVALALREGAPRRQKQPAPRKKAGGGEQDGVPSLDIVHTSNVWEAMDILDAWAEARHFGLYVSHVRTNVSEFYPQRVNAVAIAHGSKVLVFNLRPYFRNVPQPMPGFIRQFMEDESRTFFGMGIVDGAASLAFELDCVLRVVDFGVRKWPELKVKGGVYGAANRHLGLRVHRPTSGRDYQVQGKRAWLHWALADRFMRTSGPPQPAWMITRAEMYGVGPTHLKVPMKVNDWTKPRRQWLQGLHELEEVRREREKQRKRGKGGGAKPQQQQQQQHQQQQQQLAAQLPPPSPAPLPAPPLVFFAPSPADLAERQLRQLQHQQQQQQLAPQLPPPSPAPLPAPPPVFAPSPADLAERQLRQMGLAV